MSLTLTQWKKTTCNHRYSCKCLHVLGYSSSIGIWRVKILLRGWVFLKGNLYFLCTEKLTLCFYASLVAKSSALPFPFWQWEPQIVFGPVVLPCSDGGSACILSSQLVLKASTSLAGAPLSSELTCAKCLSLDATSWSGLSLENELGNSSFRAQSGPATKRGGVRLCAIYTSWAFLFFRRWGQC